MQKRQNPVKCVSADWLASVKTAPKPISKHQ